MSEDASPSMPQNSQPPFFREGVPVTAEALNNAACHTISSLLPYLTEAERALPPGLRQEPRQLFARAGIHP